MTQIQLGKAKALEFEIERVRGLLRDTQIEQVEWVEFCYGNGYSNRTVCIDSETIYEIKQLLIKKHETRIQKLQEEMAQI